MKRILYVLLSIILILQTPSFISANADEVYVNSSDFNMLKTLGVFDLVVIGIAAVVGTGIFTIIGS